MPSGASRTRCGMASSAQIHLPHSAPTIRLQQIEAFLQPLDAPSPAAQAACYLPAIKPNPHRRRTRPSPPHRRRPGVDLGADRQQTASTLLPTSIQPHPTTPHPHPLHYRSSPPLCFRSGVDLGANCLQTASTLLPTTFQTYSPLLPSLVRVPSGARSIPLVYHLSATCVPHLHHSRPKLQPFQKPIKKPPIPNLSRGHSPCHLLRR